MGNQLIFSKKGSPPAGPSASGPPSGGKGAPSVVIAIGHHKADPGDAGLGGDPGDGGDAGPDAGGPVQCPNCGCEFDPMTGDITNAGNYSGDQSNADAEPMKDAKDAGPSDSGYQGANDE